MTARDPANSIIHYPLNLSHFGVNPFGENRFRVVLASTRRSLVVGQWNGAGMRRAKYCQTYPQIPAGQYLLEEWVDAFTFTGTTAVAWEYGDGQWLGPYPSRGEYMMCGQTGFNPLELGISGVEKLVRLVHAGDKHSWAEKLTACRAAAERDELSRDNEIRARILDAFPAFGHAAFSQLSTGKGGATKTSPIRYSANELGLPVPQGIPGQATTGGAVVMKKKRWRAA